MRPLLIAAMAALAILPLPTLARAEACGAPPPTPRGHVLARVESVSPAGVATVRFAANLDKRRTPKVGDSAYSLACSGVRYASTETKIQRVDGTTAHLTLRLRPELGSYVAIDSGFDSAPPPALSDAPRGPVVQASITDVQPHADGVKIVVGAGQEDGVFDGAHAWVLDKDGNRRFGFVVQRATREAAQGIPAASVQEMLSARGVLVEVRTPKCFGPKPMASADVAKLTTGVLPRGWVWVTVPTSPAARAQWPRVVVDHGAKDRATVGQAWLVGATAAPMPVEVVSVEARRSTVAIGDPTGAHRSKALGLAMPVVPERCAP